MGNITAGLAESAHKPETYYENARKDMLKYIPQGTKRTLEFGCGGGKFSELVKIQFDAECWGVEVHPYYAALASERLHKVINANAHQSLNHLPENYFDCIIFNDVLEHLQDPYSLLHSVKSKLNEHGVVVASIPNVRFWSNLKALAVDGTWDYRDTGILDITHLRFFTYNSLRKLFRQLNYDIVTCEGIGPTYSRTFRILNMLFLNKLKDARYRHFACVFKPESRTPDA